MRIVKSLGMAGVAVVLAAAFSLPASAELANAALKDKSGKPIIVPYGESATERRKANPQRHPGQRARRDQCQPRHHRRDERGRHRPNPHDEFGVLVEPAANQKADPAPDLARQETEQQQCEIGLHRHDAALRMRCTRCAP